MKNYMLIMGVIAVTALLGTVALADKEQLQPQIKCPVMGERIDKSLFVDYEGKYIYVCCKDCIETVKKDPEKYIRKLEAGRVTFKKVQITCAVMAGVGITPPPEGAVGASIGWKNVIYDASDQIGMSCFGGGLGSRPGRLHLAAREDSTHQVSRNI
ncbi:MAG: hypothetical protein KJ964_10315 [Verrucomicrobia bacterium]|nr:hypothetical protein [Verrucomicrobiota bacterium]MBU1733807.1 hypothetical protein [Verrucomicrobiota bacterium]MBU1856169.1 hypothetical protein [Verrucomicrobiota bacterium]